MRAVRVGVLDSGIATTPGVNVLESRVFAAAARDGVVSGLADSGAHGHGTEVARIIAGLCPSAVFLDARIFSRHAPTSATVVTDGLDWLVDAKAEIVNMSFGLRADRGVLREACARALAGGIILVAATPASGGSVYPAAYPGIIRVTGDARCAVGEYTFFGTDRVDFGACNGGLEHEPHKPGGGASLAVPHIVAYLVDHLATGGEPAEAAVALRKVCHYQGREDRGR